MTENELNQLEEVDINETVDDWQTSHGRRDDADGIFD